MNLNYDIKTWCIDSLKTTTVINTTINILKIAIAMQEPSSLLDPVIILARATRIVQQLNLPSTLITDVKDMIPPIRDEILSWYQDNDRSIRPVLTQHGTVDVERSVRDWLNRNGQSVTDSFKLACNYCLEEEIFEFGSRLSADEKHIYEDEYHAAFLPIECFWYKAYKGQFVKKITGKDLSYEQCFEGYGMALKYRKLHAAMYFYENQPQETSWQSFDALMLTSHYMPMISPAWCARILRGSQTEHEKCKSSELLLKALLKWPYQHLFLEAAQTVMANLDMFKYIEVAMEITKKALKGCKDHNYKRLLIGFWKMDLGHKDRLASLNCFASAFLFNIFLMLDRDIALMVFGDMPKETKAAFYCLYKLQLAKLIYSKKIVVLYLLMDVCKEKDERWHLTFKTFFKIRTTRARYARVCENERISSEEWDENINKFRTMLSK